MSKKKKTNEVAVQNQANVNPLSLRIENGLSDALGLSTFGFPGSGTQISSVETLFKNERWYLISNMRNILSEVYVEHGVVQNAIDVPVDDGLRGGITIQSKQLGEDGVQKLTIAVDRQNILQTVGQAIKWNRLFGGSGIIIITDQDYQLPLNIAAIRKDSPLAFRAADLWELFYTQQNITGDGEPMDDMKAEHYQYYAKKVHKSRVMAMKGIQAPSFIRPRLRGWGFSVLEGMIRSINQYLKATDLSFEVLDEFKLDIFKIKNLVTTLTSQGGTEKIQQRIQIANQNKNYLNSLVLDSEDEYESKQLSFTGLAEVMDGIRKQLASDMRIPQTKLFGQSAAGFNSGEDDIEVYNSMVESQVRNKCKYDILKILEIMCQKMFGYIPTDLEIDFKPLRVLSAEQEENVKTQVFNRLQVAKQAGWITDLEFRDACNKENLLPIKLDTDESTLSGIEETAEEEGAADEDKDKNKDEKKENSAEFDRRAYEVDGGDKQWAEHRPVDFFKDANRVDESLWSKAQDASKKAFEGTINWRFVTWYYQKNGGHFK